MSSSTTELLLMRHGTAASPPWLVDFERPLAPRGKQEAALAGEWILAHGGEPDLILCSAAVRTMQTLMNTGLVTPATFLLELYHVSGADYLDLLREYGPGARRILVIGHEPTISQTAAAVAIAEDPRRSKMERGFATGAVAAFELDTNWTLRDREYGTIQDVYIPHLEQY